MKNIRKKYKAEAKSRFTSPNAKKIEELRIIHENKLTELNSLKHSLEIERQQQLHENDLFNKRMTNVRKSEEDEIESMKTKHSFDVQQLSQEKDSIISSINQIQINIKLIESRKFKIEYSF
jgi:hypothetical protein